MSDLLSRWFFEYVHQSMIDRDLVVALEPVSHEEYVWLTTNAWEIREEMKMNYQRENAMTATNNDFDINLFLNEEDAMSATENNMILNLTTNEENGMTGIHDFIELHNPVSSPIHIKLTWLIHEEMNLLAFLVERNNKYRICQDLVIEYCRQFDIDYEWGERYDDE